MRDLHQRARNVLAELAVVSEGTAAAWDTGGHGQAESRGPVSEESIDKARSREGEPGPPAKDRSLHDFYRHMFMVSWQDGERLLYWVKSAEDDLERRRRTGEPAYMLAGPELTRALLRQRGKHPAEVAAMFSRYGVTISHVKTLRTQERHDSLTGEPWLWPPPARRDSPDLLSPAARERLEREAFDKACAMLAQGESQRRVSEATGIPGRTLRRLLAGERDVA